MRETIQYWLLVLCAFAINSCCPKHGDLQNAVDAYYNNLSDTDGNTYSYTSIRIVNVKKYSCDSVDTYVRIEGSYKSEFDTISHILQRATKCTLVRRGNKYVVLYEVNEE